MDDDQTHNRKPKHRPAPTPPKTTDDAPKDEHRPSAQSQPSTRRHPGHVAVLGIEIDQKCDENTGDDQQTQLKYPLDEPSETAVHRHCPDFQASSSASKA